jgi:hypothetical protein
MKWTGAVVGIVLTLSLYQSLPIEAFVPVVPIAVPTTKTTKTITIKTRPAVWLQSKTLTNTSPLWRIQSTTTTTMTAATTTDSINGTTPPKSNMGKLQTILVKVRTILIKLCSNQKSDLLLKVCTYVLLALTFLYYLPTYIFMYIPTFTKC